MKCKLLKEERQLGTKEIHVQYVHLDRKWERSGACKPGAETVTTVSYSVLVESCADFIAKFAHHRVAERFFPSHLSAALTSLRGFHMLTAFSSTLRHLYDNIYW